MEKNEISRRQFVAALGLVSVPFFGGLEPAPETEPAGPGAASVTWLEISGKTYGARPNNVGPIGGGCDYADVVTKGDFTVEDTPGLLDALARATAGQVIFVPGEICLDLTTHIYIEELVLEIPEGVTLAGGRGAGESTGAIFTSDALKTPVMIRAMGPDVRITGLRFQGPNPKRHMEHHKRSFGPGGPGHNYYYKFPTSSCIATDFSNLKVDNCELSAFSRAAISLRKGSGHHIHHNFIHHCQYNGLGYGVSHDVANSLIEYNLFDANRHSLAGTGRPGSGYIARHNVEMGTSLSHCFDMHGGRDRKDETNIAASLIEIYGNTFCQPEKAVGIRGEPEEYCKVYQNWFTKHKNAEEAVYGLSEKTTAVDNAFGTDPPVVT